MPYKIEVTDTFGGEANYCWVKRATTRATSRRGLIRAIKQTAGWTDWCRVRVHFYDGESIEVRPVATSGIPQVAFATWSE